MAKAVSFGLRPSRCATVLHPRSRCPEARAVVELMNGAVVTGGGGDCDVEVEGKPNV